MYCNKINANRRLFTYLIVLFIIPIVFMQTACEYIVV